MKILIKSGRIIINSLQIFLGMLDVSFTLYTFQKKHHNVFGVKYSQTLILRINREWP